MRHFESIRLPYNQMANIHNLKHTFNKMKSHFYYKSTNFALRMYSVILFIFKSGFKWRLDVLSYL